LIDFDLTAALLPDLNHVFALLSNNSTHILLRYFKNFRLRLSDWKALMNLAA
jgi:hypothetical protein